MRAWNERPSRSYWRSRSPIPGEPYRSRGPYRRLPIGASNKISPWAAPFRSRDGEYVDALGRSRSRSPCETPETVNSSVEVIPVDESAPYDAAGDLSDDGAPPSRWAPDDDTPAPAVADDALPQSRMEVGEAQQSTAEDTADDCSPTSTAGSEHAPDDTPQTVPRCASVRRSKASPSLTATSVYSNRSSPKLPVPETPDYGKPASESSQRGEMTDPQSRDATSQPPREARGLIPDEGKTDLQLRLTQIMAAKMTRKPGRSDAATATEQALNADADGGTSPKREPVNRIAVVLTPKSKYKAAPKSDGRSNQPVARDWRRSEVYMCEPTASLGLQDQLRRRQAVNHDGRDGPRVAPVPSSPNVMIANWAVGRDCVTAELLQRLTESRFDIVVVVVAPAVAVDDELYVFLNAMVGRNDSSNDVAADADTRFAKEHVMLAIDHGAAAPSRSFVCLYKPKVMAAAYQRAYDPKSDAIRFGALKLTLDTERQSLTHIIVGIVDVMDDELRDDSQTWDTLAAWLCKSPVDLLTGFWGKDNWHAVAKLARRTGAMNESPCYQVVSMPDGNLSRRDLIYPNWWLLYGPEPLDNVYPDDVPPVPDTLTMGSDISARLSENVPAWGLTGEAQAGIEWSKVTMKPPDLIKWFNGCFQTAVWLGKLQRASDRQRQRHHPIGKLPSASARHRKKQTKSGNARQDKWVNVT